MNIPFLDLKRGYKIYGKEIEEAVLEVLRSGVYLNGEKTRNLEKKLSEYLGVKFAIGVSSGTEALYLILKALDPPSGSLVLLPSFTFVSTAEVVVRAGLVPYFVDVEEKTCNISLESLKETYKKLEKTGRKISGVIAVSLFGVPANLKEIRNFCEEKGLFLVEDICQAFGAEIDGKKVGTFGIASATSFYPTKPLSTCGDAGMVFTSEESLAKKIRCLKEHGQTKAYFYEYHGVNGRIDEIHSAILLVKFKYFEEELKKRKELAEMYNRELEGLNNFIKVPFFPEGTRPSYALYTIKAEKRDDLRNFLKEKGVATGIYYALPLHLQPVYRELGFKKGDLPVTENLATRVLSLPFYPYLKKEEILYIVETINTFYKTK